MNDTERLLSVFCGWEEDRELACFSTNMADLPALVDKALRETFRYTHLDWDYSEVSRIEIVAWPLDRWIHREGWEEEWLVSIAIERTWENDDSVVLPQGEIRAISNALNPEMQAKTHAAVANVNACYAKELGVVKP